MATGRMSTRSTLAALLADYERDRLALLTSWGYLAPEYLAAHRITRGEMLASVRREALRYLAAEVDLLGSTLAAEVAE